MSTQHAQGVERDLGDVERGMAQLDEAIERLAHQLDRLHGAIAGALAPEQPMEVSSLLKPLDPGLSPLGAKLYSVADTLNDRVDQLAQLIVRVQL